MATLEKKVDVLRTQLGLTADLPSDVIIGMAIQHLLDVGDPLRAHLGVRPQGQMKILTKEEVQGILPEMRPKCWTHEEMKLGGHSGRRTQGAMYGVHG